MYSDLELFNPVQSCNLYKELKSREGDIRSDSAENVKENSLNLSLKRKWVRREGSERLKRAPFRVGCSAMDKFSKARPNMNKPSKWAVRPLSKCRSTHGGIWLRPQFVPFRDILFLFCPWYNTAADRSLLFLRSSDQKCRLLTHPWTYFWPGAIHEISLPFLCEANGLENHRGDVNIWPGGSFENISGIWEVLHSTEDLKGNQQSEKNDSRHIFYLQLIFLGCVQGTFFGCIFWCIFGCFAIYCNAAALFRASDPGALWDASVQYLFASNFPSFFKF